MSVWHLILIQLCIFLFNACNSSSTFILMYRITLYNYQYLAIILLVDI